MTKSGAITVRVNDLERDFQNLAFGSDGRQDLNQHAKKIWDDDKAGGDGKGMFPGAGNPWSRDDGWNANPAGHSSAGHQPPMHLLAAAAAAAAATGGGGGGGPSHQAHPMFPGSGGGGHLLPPHLLHHQPGRPGSFHATGAAMLGGQQHPHHLPPSLESHPTFHGMPSPRSSETGALGVNMAEYVLGGSPVGKDFRGRVPNAGPGGYGPGGDGDPSKQGVVTDKGPKSQSPFEGGDGGKSDAEKELQNSNGIMQNGLEDRPTGSRQNSPTEIDGAGQVTMADVRTSLAKQDDHLQLEVQPHQALAQHHQQMAAQAGLHLDTPQFEMPGMDPFQLTGGPAGAEYSSHMLPSMDSPNFSIDYQQRQPIAILTQQQYALAQQQQQQQQLAAASPFNPAAPPPTGPGGYTIIGPPGASGTPTPGMPTPVSAPDLSAAAAAMGLQHMGTSHAGPAVMPQYYSVQAPWLYPAATPGGLLQQGGAGAVRGQTPRSLTPSQDAGLGTPTGQIGTPVSFAGGTPQYQILTPAYYDQNGQLVMGNPAAAAAAATAGRGIGTPVRLVSPAPMLLGGQQVGQQPGGIQILTNHHGQMMPTQLVTPPAHQQHNGVGAGGDNKNNNGLTPDGLSAERRSSLGGAAPFDYKRPGQLPQLSQYYGAFSQPSTSPAAGPMGLVQANSITPPPSLNGSASNLAFGGAAAGLSTAGLLGSSFLTAAAHANTRGGVASGLFPKAASLSKEGTSRSRLLEDFRNNRIPNLQLKDLVNHVVEFSQDQHGSRFIQQKLERATPAEKQMVFNEILSAAYSLMTDVFGNYVIQKFFEFGTSEQKQTLAQRVRGHVLPLALQMYGCRVIQKALESIPQEMQVEIVKELDGHVLKCVKDQNGNHVVQKCIECVEPNNLQFIIDAFRGQIFTLSTHPYGCRVIQRILEHCIPEQTGPILDELHSQTERLVQDQYGNYVIQHVLEHGRQDDKSKIVSELRGKMLLLSQHKFASNVVEKCISNSSRAERACLIEEVCGMNDGALYTMMKDQFANYVVQKMIDVADGPQRKMLLHKIRPHVATLRKFTYGKHILAKLEKFYMKTSDLGPIGMPPNGALQ